MQINLTDAAGKTHTISHDLNFQTPKYETKHVITFKNPKAPSALLDRLRNSGSVPGDTVNGEGKKRASEVGAGGAAQKKKKADGKSVDMDKLAEGLQKLGEDDLLQVVQMVHDNKSEDSWMRNDVERESCIHLFHETLLERRILTFMTFTEGEFHVDLYTLPDSLISMLWTFTKEKGAVEVGA